MTLNIDLTPEQEARLTAAARSQRLDPAALIQRFVSDHLPELETTAAAQAPSATAIDAKNAAAIALLDSWLAAGASADAETRRQAEQELEEFKRNMNANRAATGERLLFP